MPSLTRLRRGHPLQLAALLLLLALLLVTGIFWLRSVRRAPSELQGQNRHEVRALERQLERAEVRARLESFAAAVQAGRDPEELERRLERIRSDLEAGYQDSSRARRQELQAALDELGQELRGGAAVTASLERLFELLMADPEGASGDAP